MTEVPNGRNSTGNEPAESCGSIYHPLARWRSPQFRRAVAVQAPWGSWPTPPPCECEDCKEARAAREGQRRGEAVHGRLAEASEEVARARALVRIALFLSSGALLIAVVAFCSG